VKSIASIVKQNQLLISDKHQNDRLHIGCSLVCGADVLISYNFRHLVNIKTIRGVRAISLSNGYPIIEITTAKIVMGL